MSALRVSRNAAELSDVIAVDHSFASIACLPAA
jgi:hypothetical protein